MKSLILIPAKCENYSFWPVVGSVDVDNPGNILTFTCPTSSPSTLSRMLNDAADGSPPPCDHFFWGNQTIDGSTTRQWLVIEVEQDELSSLDYKVRYQRERLASGWHVSYIQHDDSFTGVDNGLRFEP